MDNEDSEIYYDPIVPHIGVFVSDVCYLLVETRTGAIKGYGRVYREKRIEGKTRLESFQTSIF